MSSKVPNTTNVLNSEVGEIINVPRAILDAIVQEALEDAERYV